MLSILVYAFLQGIFSTRKIEEACRYNIRFMYLLEGKRVPDHTTISRFLTDHLRSYIKETFAQMDGFLARLGAIDLTSVFVDGTKLESVANKYKYVWKGTIVKKRVFANIKADLGFRRFLSHGQENALVTVMLLAMAFNVQKLHHKIQNETLKRHLIPVDKAA